MRNRMVSKKKNPLIYYFCSFCLGFFLLLYVPVNNFSVMSGQVFLGLTNTKHELCLAQENNAVMPVRLEPANPWPRVKHYTAKLPLTVSG